MLPCPVQLRLSVHCPKSYSLLRFLVDCQECWRLSRRQFPFSTFARLRPGLQFNFALFSLNALFDLILNNSLDTLDFVMSESLLWVTVRHLRFNHLGFSFYIHA